MFFIPYTFCKWQNVIHAGAKLCQAQVDFWLAKHSHCKLFENWLFLRSAAVLAEIDLSWSDQVHPKQGGQIKSIWKSWWDQIDQIKLIRSILIRSKLSS